VIYPEQEHSLCFQLITGWKGFFVYFHITSLLSHSS